MWRQEFPTQKHPTITYKTIEIMDLPSTKISSYFREAFDFIEAGKASGGVLVGSL